MRAVASHGVVMTTLVALLWAGGVNVLPGPQNQPARPLLQVQALGPSNMGEWGPLLPELRELPEGPALGTAPLPTSTKVPRPKPTPVQGPPPPAPAPMADWQSLVCSYPWPCQEALYVIRHESGGNHTAINPNSGACGLFQTLPCVGYNNLEAHLAEAYRKWSGCGGGSFQCAWYNWW